MLRKNIVTIFSIIFFFNLIFLAYEAKAQWVTADIPSGVGAGAGIAGDVGIFGQLGTTLGKYVTDATANIIITASKVAALLAVQQTTQAIIGKGGGGVIYDWNNYLYISPQQRAMSQMNSFFNTVSKGRLSSLNYEGVGPNYDAYLVAQARMAIAGQPFSTNLQEQASDPTQIFATGNMKGIMTYMQCANNPACYTLVSTAKYNTELQRATEIAVKSQDRGFLPVKQNGKIIQPAAIVSGALMQIDQLGTQVIMNAEAKSRQEFVGAEAQIAAGTGINITARLFNYMLADSKGKEAIRNKNDQFPFSLSYSTNTGIGISAGGVSISTGAGAIASQTMIGNTCATAAAIYDPKYGPIVAIDGKKYSCQTKQVVTGTQAGSVTTTAPSITTPK